MAAFRITIKRWHAVAAWTWSAGADEDVCGICHTAYDGCAPECKYPGDDSTVVWGACSHAFHIQCIQKWLASSSAEQRCPMCRRPWEYKSAIDSAPTDAATPSGPQPPDELTPQETPLEDEATTPEQSVQMLGGSGGLQGFGTGSSVPQPGSQLMSSGVTAAAGAPGGGAFSVAGDEDEGTPHASPSNVRALNFLDAGGDSPIAPPSGTNGSGGGGGGGREYDAAGRRVTQVVGHVYDVNMSSGGSGFNQSGGSSLL